MPHQQLIYLWLVLPLLFKIALIILCMAGTDFEEIYSFKKYLTKNNFRNLDISESDSSFMANITAVGDFYKDGELLYTA